MVKRPAVNKTSKNYSTFSLPLCTLA